MGVEITAIVNRTNQPQPVRSNAIALMDSPTPIQRAALVHVIIKFSFLLSFSKTQKNLMSWKRFSAITTPAMNAPFLNRNHDHDEPFAPLSPILGNNENKLRPDKSISKNDASPQLKKTIRRKSLMNEVSNRLISYPHVKR